MVNAVLYDLKVCVLAVFINGMWIECHSYMSFASSLLSFAFRWLIFSFLMAWWFGTKFAEAFGCVPFQLVSQHRCQMKVAKRTLYIAVPHAS